MISNYTKSHRKALINSTLNLLLSTIEASIKEARNELNDASKDGFQLLSDRGNPLRKEIIHLENMLSSMQVEKDWYNKQFNN